MSLNSDKKSYYLFLDDTRVPTDVMWINLPSCPWVVVKNYKEFVDTITKHGVPKIISFDHDLAQEHYSEYIVANDAKMLNYGCIRYAIFKEKTGYDCAKWLAKYCVNNNIPIPLYYIHTMNPIGFQNIYSVLESARKAMSK